MVWRIRVTANAGVTVSPHSFYVCAHDWPGALLTGERHRGRLLEQKAGEPL
jgi:hypothetical protein